MTSRIIYILSDPSGQIFYVGATLLRRRFARERDHRRRFGTLFIMTPIEDCGDDWRDREHYWIEHFRSLDAPLVNKSVGGEGCQALSDEAKAKISLANSKPRGPMSQQTKKLIGSLASERMAALTEKERQTRRDRARSVLAKRNATEKLEFHKAGGRASYGRKHTAEAKEKMAVNKGKMLSPEWRAKISASSHGHKKSDATKARMSIAAKLREERKRAARNKSEG
jgi:hypothetical protein